MYSLTLSVPKRKEQCLKQCVAGVGGAVRGLNTPSSKVPRHQSAVAMRLGTKLASAEFASLSWRSTTGRAMDRENLLGSHNFLHGGKDDVPKPAGRNGQY